MREENIQLSQNAMMKIPLIPIFRLLIFFIFFKLPRFIKIIKPGVILVWNYAKQQHCRKPSNGLIKKQGNALVESCITKKQYSPLGGSDTPSELYAAAFFICPTAYFS